ncbi:MAG TPA: TonB family protein [Pyrinomonadaceae bacterium]|nr:TonB family protein [Pyrinomonadaceae bacterium]
MNRYRRIFGSIFGVAVFLPSAVVIFSQQPSGDVVFQRQPFQEPGSTARTPPPRDDTFNFISGEMSFDGKLVKGAPYSAQVVTETTQTLSDGNRIVNRATASIYRDSEGRTRREQTLRTIGGFATAGDAPQMIFINDPVAQMNYVLDARTHVARKMPFFRFEVRVAPPAEAGKPPSSPEGQTPPVDRVENNGNVYVMTEPPASGGYRVEYFGGGKRAKAESLGKQLIEGVQAEGTRTTVTIAAGEIGNELPIAIVNERWYSPELETVVMSRQTDPRFGETVYRLTNIDRSEPDKSWFEVPAEYTIQGQPIFTAQLMPGSDNSSVSNSPTTTSSAAGVISGGVLNGKAISMPAAEYPLIAKQAHASGAVTVQVTVDEGGNVILAKAVAGHPLLQAAAVAAARQAKFAPTRLSGQPVKVNGVLIYNFTAQ